MFVIADESVDAPVVAAIRAQGLLVEAIVETSPSSGDDAVLSRAASTQAVLVTLDRDFGELIFLKNHRPPRAVIYLRSEGMSMARMIAAVLSALRDPTLDGQHVTIDRNQTRKRSLPSSGETNG